MPARRLRPPPPPAGPQRSRKRERARLLPEERLLSVRFDRGVTEGREDRASE